ncbi:InlB B-repeat-containing protein [Alkalibacter rhizosphaerae]|uniref:InlB B-repeat-containing protein n=1 Tax=Alkalibacter rhizosphaerae TaxID=2815577 RepID=A0A975AI36_9FIRM|nr:InlB B-repeat-containing protein [Alkalibacter rhizosphaerae]QSX09259.1 InlB B-repeat-containing protein [Alkalibacter rhizosphaerae]
MQASKRIIVLLLALLLVLTYFPVGIFAVADYVDFDFRDPAGDDYPDLTGREDISWDEDTNTLTLTDFDLGEKRSAFLLPDDSTVVLVGENVITASETSEVGIWGWGSLTITGNGSLVIKEPFVGIVAEGNLVLSNTTIAMQGIHPEYLPTETGLSSLPPFSLLGLYAEYGKVLLDDTDLTLENFFFGINSGMFGGSKSISQVEPEEMGVSITDSNVSMTLTLSEVEFNSAAIASVEEDVDITASTVDVEGYQNAIVAGYMDYGFFAAEAPFTLQGRIAPSGNINITGSSLDLTGSGLVESYYPGHGLLAKDGDISITDSNVGLADFMVAASGGFEIRPSNRSMDETVLDTQNITVNNSQVEIRGFGYDADLEYGMPSLGLVTANGNITLTETSAIIDDVHSGIAAGVQGTGEVLFHTSNVTIGVVGDQSAMIQAVIGTVSAPIMVSEVEPDHIVLQDCYIKVPVDGSVERYETELKDLQMQLAESLIFDYIEATLEGEVVISTYPVVSFDSNGGDPVESQTVLPGEKAEEPSNPDRYGYTFDGWFTDDETFEDPWDFEAEAMTENTTLYAKWSRDPQKITYVEEDDTTGVGAAGMEENVNLPETEDESIVEITVFVKAEETDVEEDVKDKVLTELAGKGYDLLGVYDIGLFKRVTDLNGVTTEMEIDNEDITGEITVRIPLTADQAAKEKLAMAFIDEAGEVTIMEGSVVTVGEDPYFVFTTDHFSTYALVEMTREANPATGYETDVDPTEDSSGVLPYVGVALLGIAAVAWKRRRAF